MYTQRTKRNISRFIIEPLTLHSIGKLKYIVALARLKLVNENEMKTRKKNRRVCSVTKIKTNKSIQQLYFHSPPVRFRFAMRQLISLESEMKANFLVL